MFKHLLSALLLTTLAAPLCAAEQPTAPAAYEFQTPEAKTTWRAGLPEDCVEITPTCVYSKAKGEVYLLAEMTGLGKGYEVEFFALGRLSDRAYEGLFITWDHPSTINKAIEGLGVAKGVAANAQRGLSMAQGERFTVHVKRIGQDETARPLSDFISDECSTPAQDLFGRGFPYVGGTGFDDDMPAALIAAYTESKSTFGLPYYAPKGAVYGLFRSKEAQEGGKPAAITLRWERLPNGQARVYHKTLDLTAATLANPEPLLTELKALSDDPRDVFLDVRLAPELKLADLKRFAPLFLAVEAQGGFTLDTPAKGQIPIRAFAPNEQWRDRKDRVFQPWEIEVTKDEKGALSVTLCQILEDWTVEGLDPALTRKCYPGQTAQTILEALRKVDVNGGKVYVAFFYCTGDVTVADVAPLDEALAEECPTQWIYL